MATQTERRPVEDAARGGPSREDRRSPSCLTLRSKSRRVSTMSGADESHPRREGFVSFPADDASGMFLTVC